MRLWFFLAQASGRFFYPILPNQGKGSQKLNWGGIWIATKGNSLHKKNARRADILCIHQGWRRQERTARNVGRGLKSSGS
jgi:hypothetical protein